LAMLATISSSHLSSVFGRSMPVPYKSKIY
jgi:hypothetical protein